MVQYGLDTDKVLTRAMAGKIRGQSMNQKRWEAMVKGKVERPVGSEVAQRYGSSAVSASFVGRYLKFPLNPKGSQGLSRTESADILASKVAIVSVFEGANRIGHFKKPNDVTDANLAVRRSIILRQPLRSAIYFAVDFDCVSPADRARVAGYFVGLKSRMDGALKGVYAIGAYASHFVLDMLFQEGLIDYCWQAGAYGWKQNDSMFPDADIVQFDPGDGKYVKIDSASFDHNTAGFSEHNKTFGQWSRELVYDKLSGGDQSKLETAWSAAGGQGTAKDPTDDWQD
jgi:Domain of unknown function (DUF1906)